MSGDNEEILSKLIAGQAASEQRFTEMFRRLDKAETAAGEARDTAKEIATILREQNALARVAEVKAETHQLVQDLRADVVLAHKNLRSDAVELEKRVDVLEAARAAGQGMARGGRMMVEGLKIVIAAGGGALLVRLFHPH